MTEKRFTTVELPKPNRWGIWYDGAYLSTYQVCILLNEYVDVKKENEQLKQQLRNSVELFRKDSVTLFELKEENKELKVNYKELRYANNIYCNKIDSLKKENEQLKKENNILKASNGEYEDALARLEEENEQLKNKIDVLEDDNEKYHKSLEKLNLYTKRFIPTKCTNEFKDCKTNRYYWLDHEGNFEGCLELLNLLDCENEVLTSENSQLKAKLMVYEEQMKGDFE